MATREYTVPLRRGFHKTPRYKRSKKAITVLREFLVRHLKTENIKIGQHLNEHVWARGIRSPPGKVEVIADISEEDGMKIARVELKGKSFKESVRPDEKVEQASGLKGKLQELAGAKEPKSLDEKTEEKEPTPAKADKKPEATPKKTQTAKPTKQPKSTEKKKVAEEKKKTVN